MRRAESLVTLNVSATLLLAVLMTAGDAGARHPPSTAAPAFAVHSIALPGAAAGGVAMDYLAYDRVHHRLWVPAGNTAGVDVVDVGTEQITRIGGFPVSAIERKGAKRSAGPSSATVGAGVVYVGNRGDSSVCAIDAESLRKGACLTLDSPPDGLAYVASTKEVWATLPRARSIAIIGAAVAGALTRTATIRLDGQPEGFAVDNARGRFYTNLEDTDRTLTIDVGTRQVTSTWPAGCGAEGPRGLALDPDLDVLFVACPDRVRAVDARHDGKQLSTIAVGGGLDNIDYVQRRHELYAAAGRAAALTITRVGADGALTPSAVVPTLAGARNAVASDEGTAYLTDSAAGKILVVAPSRAAPTSPE
jgi:DNA-binding beta-propeller fold protein YncE